MKRALRIVAGIMLLMGTIWFFQGIGVLPGSFMSGQRQWAINGAILDAVGVVLWVWAARR